MSLLRTALGLFAMSVVAMAAAAPGAAAQSPGPYGFAPYTDFTDSSSPALGTIRRGARVRHPTLGFVTALDGTECVPTWGGSSEQPASGANAYRLSQVAELRAAGGDPVVSFGGQAGTELAKACATAEDLAAAYRDVIATYGATHIDFDIEGGALGDTATDERREQAIAQVQMGSPLQVSYTLPVLPTGLTAEGLALLGRALASGVRIDLVNIMAMDYGKDAAPRTRGRMAALAIRAARSTRRQLQPLFPDSSSSALMRKLGVTSLIGINDVPTEIFTLRDARKFVRWARRAKLGMISMWSLGRDRRCARPTRRSRDDCSGVAQRRWAFSKVLGAGR
jgi:hypothetical protein